MKQHEECKNNDSQITIPIAMICDDNYIVPTAVAISSMVSTKSPKSRYDIYIVCASLSEKSESAFFLLKTETVSIHIIRENANRFAELHTNYQSDLCVASPTSLLKFSLPDLFPQFNKILFLDSDILIRSDLSELYSIDLKDNLLAAVLDSSAIYKPQYQFVPYYFNSGVMLINLDQMRLEHTKEKLIQEKVEHSVTYLMDQHAFNCVCTGKIHELPIRYNLLAVILDKAKDSWTVEDINRSYNTSYNSQDEILKDWIIVHFASKDKPWKNPFVLYANEWFDVYRSLPKVFQTLADYPTLLSQTNITVSLTSFPARIQYVSQVIDSLKLQSVRPDRVVIYLSKTNFDNAEEDLPETLLKQVEAGMVEIHWCDLDLKPHKKYFYAMQEYQNDIIITVDDDEIYPNTMIEELMLCWLQFPNAISARRTHLITFNRAGEILPYENWINTYNNRVLEPSMQLLAVGCSGVLYPPHKLPSAVFNAGAIQENALYTDDIWLKAHEVMCGIPVVLAVNHDKLKHIKGSQEIGLYHQNQFNGGNDKALLKIRNYLDKIYNKKDVLESALFSSKKDFDYTETIILIEYIQSLKEQNSQKNKSNQKNQNTIRKLQKKLKGQNSTNKKLRKELQAVKTSRSFKIGRFITWLPRKIRDAFRR